MAAQRDVIQYHIFTRADSDEMAQLLAETFTERDPPAVAVGLNRPEFEALVRLYCPKADAEGLTMIARSLETGEMMGSLLAEEATAEPPQGMDRLSPKFDPIFDLLGNLDAAYQSEAPPGEAVHLFLLGVAARYAGQSLAQQLVARSVAHSASKGYRVAFAEATNRTSQHIFRKQGFVERVRCSYRDHQFQGQAVFASIAEHGGPILMEKKLPLRAPLG